MFPDIIILGYHLRIYPFAGTIVVVFCWLLLVRRTDRMGYPRGAVLLWLGLAFPVGAMGARALETVGLALAAAPPQPDGGMTALGAIGACIVFSFFYLPRVFDEPPWRMGDAVAFALPLSMGLGRFSCLALGCCFGAPSQGSGPQWLQIPVTAYAAETAARASVPHADQLLWNLPLLLSLQCAITLLGVELFYRSTFRRLWKPGATLAVAVLLDALGRGPIELLRGGQPAALAGISISQWWLVLFAGIATVGLVRTRVAPVERSIVTSED